MNSPVGKPVAAVAGGFKHSMLRSFAIAVSLAIAGQAFAWQLRGGLAPGEGFVVLKVSGDIRGAVFQRFQGEETFAVDRDSDGQVVRVKAGRYYLKNITPTHFGIKLAPYLEPAEPSQTVSIREGVVNYIGDWKFVEDQASSELAYDPQLRFDFATFKAAVHRYRLQNYKLMVSKFGERPIDVTLP